jgi:hypothetical protein
MMRNPCLDMCEGGRRDAEAGGTALERWTGVAVVHAGGTRAADDVVFGEPAPAAYASLRS